ncbi:hypothetical protein RRF57_007992 [Xylaria bambusicola]|uniref:Uncharacterized protein n=1 Tax=Xylaria bambusicola TaxID=326684 RepID=A0AAN7ULZ3_9PEZI
MSTGSLDHRDVITLFQKVLRNIMGRVARTNYDSFLALAVLPSSRELGRVTQAITFENFDAFYRRLIFLARVSSGLNNVTRVKSPNVTCPVFALSVDDYRPGLFGLVPFGVNKLRPCPHIEFEESGIRLKELSKFVFWREDGPLCGEVEVR